MYIKQWQFIKQLEWDTGVECWAEVNDQDPRIGS